VNFRRPGGRIDLNIKAECDLVKDAYISLLQVDNGDALIIKLMMLIMKIFAYLIIKLILTFKAYDNVSEQQTRYLKEFTYLYTKLTSCLLYINNSKRLNH